MTKLDLLSRLSNPSLQCSTTMTRSRKERWEEVDSLLSWIQLGNTPMLPKPSLASHFRSNSFPRSSLRTRPSALDLLDQMMDLISLHPSDASTLRVSPGSFRRKSIQPHSLSSSDRHNLVSRTLPGIQSLQSHPYSTQLNAPNSLMENGPTSSSVKSLISTTSFPESMLWEPTTGNERRLEPLNLSSVPALLLRLSDWTIA